MVGRLGRGWQAGSSSSWQPDSTGGIVWLSITNWQLSLLYPPRGPFLGGWGVALALFGFPLEAPGASLAIRWCILGS
jgi:hypothetical protein